MIYTNIKLKAQDIELDFGKIHCMSLGERGRGRRIINMCAPPTLQSLEPGTHADLTIGMTKSGKPRINLGTVGLFLLLDTKFGYTGRGDGVISVWRDESGYISVLASGNSADGDAGRIGQAAARVIQVYAPCWIRVRLGGTGEGDARFFLRCDPEAKTVTKVTFDHMPDAMDAGLPVPEGWENIENWTMI